MQQTLSHAIVEKDLDWWNNKIKEIQIKTSGNKNTLEHKMYKRLKAYLGILAFTYSSKALATKESEPAREFLEIYELLEPKNPDVFLFKAKYYILVSDKQKAVEMLEMAVALGIDRRKIEADNELKDLLKP
jgi:hypothetical protein